VGKGFFLGLARAKHLFRLIKPFSGKPASYQAGRILGIGVSLVFGKCKKL
jgi:hypothetical protein